MFNLKSTFLFLLFISSSALAINVGKVTTIISADADSTAKEIKNEADSVRIVSGFAHSGSAAQWMKGSSLIRRKWTNCC